MNAVKFDGNYIPFLELPVSEERKTAGGKTRGASCSILIEICG
jgi:hypothetical protein